jgi:eukaryotic-like serine/threonine-protein kinase
MGFTPDDRIGNYRVEAELGPSGSGLLIHAQHLVLPRRVILKVVHPAFASVQTYVLQTLREACILEAIAHPGVPIVYESGVLRDRRPWFAFEVIAGPTVEDLLAPGPIPLVEVAGLVRDIADILEHAHRRGVIHRGLRPDRIVITSERRYPLCIPDWSEAIAHDATAYLPQVASEGARCYLAPELAEQGAGGTHELVDDRADMFALGVIAYRALTGRLPFTPERIGDPQAGVYLRAHDRRPDAPRELAAIIDSLLSFDRFDRPSASEVRADIDWLFETVPELRTPARRDAPPIAAEPDTAPRRGGWRVQRHAAGQPDSTRGRVEDHSRTKEDIVRLEPPRLRRPRWTPNVRYLETTRVDIKLATEDDRTKD